MAGGVAELARESRVVLTGEQVEGTADRLPVAWQGFSELVDKGDVLYLADGAVRLRVGSVRRRRRGHHRSRWGAASRRGRA